MKYLYILFVFAPIAILGKILHWSPVLIFLTSALAVIPAAGLMGRSTEEIAAHTGPRLGGLLNATLGNAAELIITIFAIHRRAARSGEGVDHRLDHRQRAARDGLQRLVGWA